MIAGSELRVYSLSASAASCTPPGTSSWCSRIACSAPEANVDAAVTTASEGSPSRARPRRPRAPPCRVPFIQSLVPPARRFSGAGFGYNLAYVAFGGTAPYFSLW